MQLSSRPDDCWSSHIVSAMTVLIQECMFEETLRNCEPIDLSRFVVDFRERHFEFWTPYSDGCPREHNSKFLTYNRWCAMPPKKALAARSPYSLPKYMFLDLPRDMSFAVLPVSDCVSIPFALRPQHGTPPPPPPVICVKLMMMSRMISMLISTAHTPIQCLFAGDTSPYSQEHRMFSLFCTTSNKLYFFLHELFL